MYTTSNSVGNLAIPCLITTAIIIKINKLTIIKPWYQKKKTSKPSLQSSVAHLSEWKVCLRNWSMTSVRNKPLTILNIWLTIVMMKLNSRSAKKTLWWSKIWNWNCKIILMQWVYLHIWEMAKKTILQTLLVSMALLLPHSKF